MNDNPLWKKTPLCQLKVFHLNAISLPQMDKKTSKWQKMPIKGVTD